jgi:antitoxin component YwqK of YwqJK toxin-antitoxin module
MIKIFSFFLLLVSLSAYAHDRKIHPSELDFSSNTFCDRSPKVQIRNSIFYLPNTVEPYSGKNLCFYLLNGQYRSQGDMKNGLRHGKWTYWHINGEIEFKRNFKEGREIGEDGSVISRYESGKIGKAINYKDENYIDAKLDGNWTSWYESGQIQEDKNYIDGKLDGKWTSWDENGQLISEANFTDGKLNGKLSIWDKNGQLISESNYKKDQKHGFYSKWYKNGQIKLKGNYKDGIREGTLTVWHKDGNLKHELNFKEGELDGKWTSWDEHGKIILDKVY